MITRGVVAWGLVATVMVLLACGCSRDGSAWRVPNFPSHPNRGDTITDVAPWMPVDAEGRTVTGTFMRYQTTDRAGAPREVSGTFFVPEGDSPPAGWSVMVLAHGSTGIDSDCAPSDAPDLRGVLGEVKHYLGKGLAVAVPNYPGLAGPGPHPYLDAYAAGASVIDAVRAFRQLYPGRISTTWVSLGSSQGGAAAWAANELAATYAPELQLLGVAAKVPTADMSGLADRAANGSLSTDQAGLLVWFEEAMNRQYPGASLDDYRHGNLVGDWNDVTGCNASQGRMTLKSLPSNAFAPADSDAQAQLSDALERFALPRTRTAAPMLVAYGDADTFVDHQWTADAVKRACALGDHLQIDVQPGKNHLNVALDKVYAFIDRVLAGEMSPNDCRQT